MCALPISLVFCVSETDKSLDKSIKEEKEVERTDTSQEAQRQEEEQQKGNEGEIEVQEEKSDHVSDAPSSGLGSDTEPTNATVHLFFRFVRVFLRNRKKKRLTWTRAWRLEQCSLLTTKTTMTIFW